MEHLKAYDPATQQMLISMMPVLVQLSEGKLQNMKREEMDILLEQLSRVPPASCTSTAMRLLPPAIMLAALTGTVIHWPSAVPSTLLSAFVLCAGVPAGMLWR